MWLDPVGNTPRIVQVDFGAWGQYMPGDGDTYCAPPSLVMGPYWLYANGFTQVAPGPFVDQDDQDTISLERIIAGLLNTSSKRAPCRACSPACRLTSRLRHRPSQYAYTPSTSRNPDLAWLAASLLQCRPESSPSTIVLADFAVGWFSGTSTLGQTRRACALPAHGRRLRQPDHPQQPPFRRRSRRPERAGQRPAGGVLEERCRRASPSGLTLPSTSTPRS